METPVSRPSQVTLSVRKIVDGLHPLYGSYKANRPQIHRWQGAPKAGLQLAFVEGLLYPSFFFSTMVIGTMESLPQDLASSQPQQLQLLLVSSTILSSTIPFLFCKRVLHFDLEPNMRGRLGDRYPKCFNVFHALM